MMQDSTVRPTDVALVDDAEAWNGSWGSLKVNQRPQWYGRHMGKGPFFSKAAVWHAWNSRSLYPTFDIGEDIREADAQRGRGWRVLGYGLFLCILAAGATWAIWAGR